MSFLNRLFNRKKPDLVREQPPLRRSLTEPTPGSQARSTGPSTDKSDADTFDFHGPSRFAAARPRRVACELSRAKTSMDVGGASIRSSASSAAGEGPAAESGAKGQYRQLRALHRSRLHTIMAAQDRQSKLPVVLKTFYKARLSSTLRAKLDAEVQHLRALSGVPGVVKFIGQVEDEECIHIVLERVTGTTLIEAVANNGGRIPEHTLVPDVLIPLCQLLASLHSRGIVHRQLKPEHVLCCADRGGVTLVDFAEAVNVRQRCLNNRAGTLEYMAPEVLDKPTAEEVFHKVLYNGMSEEELPQYDEKADVWSLGALVYEALTGCQPFLADNVDDMALQQRSVLADVDEQGVPRAIADRQLSADARSFLADALQLDPAARPSAERLLKHPLLQRYWAQHQMKQVELRLSAAAAESCLSPVIPGLCAAELEPQAVAAMTAIQAGGCVPSGGGAAMLMAAPMQFSVR